MCYTCLSLGGVNLEIDKYRDPIHGFIEVREHENRIIGSAPFQRLRNIKQLAMTYYIYHGAEHTRFGHSLGVMHLVTRAYRSAVQGFSNKFSEEKQKWHEQILRLIALTHDIGHAPFSHASEGLFPEDKEEHEDYTVEIITNTEIADIINDIGKEFVEQFGEEYNITPKLICDIYTGKDSGPNSEFTFLKSFMDSELDCDKMDYLLRDSYYCGVKYGAYDVERLISSFTVCYKDDIPRLAIKSGGVQVFEEFVLARYFMFIQVYFHRTRRFFDIMLLKALSEVLPNGTYPSDVDEYLGWDDCRVIQLLKENAHDNIACRNIIQRIVYPRVDSTKAHPSDADKRIFKRNAKELKEKLGEEHFITDMSAGKMPHKIPKRIEVDDEQAIVIFDEKTGKKTTISEESEIIKNLTEKIDILSLYCDPECSEEAFDYIRKINEE